MQSDGCNRPEADIACTHTPPLPHSAGRLHARNSEHKGSALFCPACGVECVASAHFCMSCGAALPNAASPAIARSAPAISPRLDSSRNRSGSILQAPLFAGLWRRLAAAIVDGILIYLLAGMLYFLISRFYGDDSDVLPFVIFAGSMGMTGLGYFSVLEASSLQATLGKRLLGIKGITTDGQRIGFGRALGRNLAKAISLLILFPLGFLMSGFTLRKQSLHDLIVGCLIVRQSVTAADLAAAVPATRGITWWTGLLASLALGLLLLSWLVIETAGEYEIRRSLGLLPADEPLLRGNGARPVP